MFFLEELPTKDMLASYQQQYPEMDSEKLFRMLFLLREASQIIRSLEQLFVKHGLSQTRFFILILLDREKDKEGLTPMELSKKLNVTKVVVSKTIKVLLDNEYLTKKKNEQDTRSYMLQLTPKGKEKLHDVLPEYYQFINGLDI